MRFRVERLQNYAGFVETTLKLRDHKWNQCPGLDEISRDMEIFKDRYPPMNVKIIDLIFNPERRPLNIYKNSEDTLVLSFELDNLPTIAVLEFAGTLGSWNIDEFNLFAPEQGIVGVRLWWD